MSLKFLCPFLLFSLTAAADVPTGRQSQFTHVRNPRPIRMALVALGQSGRYLVDVFGDLEVDDRFQLLDQEGSAGEMVVRKVTRTDQHCRGLSYRRGDVEVLGRAPAGATIAVRVDGQAARHLALLPRERVLDEPLPGASRQAQALVDVDGDGRVDLARYLHDCDGGVTQAPAPGRACVGEWQRRGTLWQEIARVRLPCS